MVLDENGYVRITDFGIAKSFSNNNAKETSGTPGYMAPEVMKGQNHTFTVDFFALGIMGYEFMLGRRPYNGRSRREIKEQMLSRNAQISLRDIPNGWSEDAADFFNKLMQRKPENRLGNKGIWELKQHRWLKYFPWEQLINKELEAPFIPDKKDNFDKKYCEANDTINIETILRYEKYKSDSEYYNCFINFTFYRIITENVEEKMEPNEIMSNTVKNTSRCNLKNGESKENDQDDIVNMMGSNEGIDTNNSNILMNQFKKEDIKIKNQNRNLPNYKFNQDKFPNVSSKNTIKSISFTMRLSENQKETTKKILNNRINNLKKDVMASKQPLLLKNDNSLDDSISSNNIFKNNRKKLTRSKTPIFNEQKRFVLERNSKNYSENRRSQYKSKKRNLSNNNRAINNKLIMSHYQYNNYKENIRNLFSQRAKQKMIICTPGYYSKNSFQMNNNSCKSTNLQVKRNSNSDFSKSPIMSKSPKITTSTSTSLQGYKKKNKSVSPMDKNQYFLRHNYTVKNIHRNYINERNTNSRVNLNRLYNQNFSYVKRMKELHSLNFNNNRMLNNLSNNITNINSKNKKQTNEIISSYSISSSSILKQIRNTNYNKYKNNVNKNNVEYLYKNMNLKNNQKMKQNSKISLELELNEDCQAYNKSNKINNKKDNNSKHRKMNTNVSIKNNIINKSNSTINISSMKVPMNGNININVVIKGNNNTTNLINKIEVKKKNVCSDLKNRTTNKKMKRSNSSGYFSLKYN